MSAIQVPARTTRVAAALVFLAMGLGAMWESHRLQGLPGSDAVGSGAFPGLASIALTLAALGLLSGIGDSSQPLQIEAPLRVFSAMVALIGFVASMGQMSILVPIGVFTAVFQLLLGERRPVMVLGGSLGLAGAVWLLFGVLLGVPL